MLCMLHMSHSVGMPLLLLVLPVALRVRCRRQRQPRRWHWHCCCAADKAKPSRLLPPLLLSCYLQIAVIEFARNVLGMAEANSTEWDQATAHPVVVFMPEGGWLGGWGAGCCLPAWAAMQAGSTYHLSVTATL